MRSILILIFIFTASLFSAEVERSIINYINDNPGRSVNIWIFFKDKGPEKDLSVYEVNEYLSERAVKRRSKMQNFPFVSFSDYPVYPDYIDQIKNYALKFNSTSRWLNAVSVKIKPEQIEQIKGLDFVDNIRLVKTYKKKYKKEENSILEKPAIAFSEDTLNYGKSKPQVEQIGVTVLHEKGFTGKGVVIAMLDDGFNRYNTHKVFDSLTVLDTWDFINLDTDVADAAAKPTEGWHGTMTLSVVGGNSPGMLIGAAYNASFLLYKTEIDADEIQIEEDNWVAGLERAEAMGADIVNSSLGYSDWYTWEDMDGKTAVTTLATITAEAKGMIVVNSAGNNGGSDVPNSLNAPADGEFVITVGGVYKDDSYWGQSSFGPTADGRIKPDVCAQGTGVYRASYSNDETFSSGSGTSFSSPLTAGAIALLVEAFPDITPPEVRDAIRKTASQANDPDNLLGYGVLNIEAAYEYILNDSLPKPPAPTPKSLNRLFTSSTKIHYDVSNLSRAKITVYDALGRRVYSFPQKFVNAGEFEIISGNLLKASGIYFYHIDGKNMATGRKINKSGKLVYLK
ncbi:MAG: S8 family serine peptidase [Calditrichaeota bacterium]|nr:S8 family serine peptidase [Calditrichota bacterium]